MSADLRETLQTHQAPRQASKLMECLKRDVCLPRKGKVGNEVRSQAEGLVCFVGVDRGEDYNSQLPVCKKLEGN
jgi:hypothetical protein